MTDRSGMGWGGGVDMAAAVVRSKTENVKIGISEFDSNSECYLFTTDITTGEYYLVFLLK